MSSVAITRMGDLCLEGGKVVLAPTLESEVLFSLFVDARSERVRVGENPRGYWAAPGVGTRLWTRLGLPNGAATHRLIEQDIREGLAFLTAEGKASSVEVEASSGGGNKVGVEIVVARGAEEVLRLKFSNLWEELGFSSVAGGGASTGGSG